MPAEPLLALVARATGEAVEAVDETRIESGPLREVDRLRWRGSGGGGTLLFRRFARAAGVEAALLPLLSRRGLAVETVLASGIPPRHAPEQRPWVLSVEPEGDPLCDHAEAGAARRAAEALRAAHDAMRGELATLRALGVPQLGPETLRDEALAATALLAPEDAGALRALADATDVAALAAIPPTLVHGAATCERARVGARVTILDWSRAHVGCALADPAALFRSLEARHPDAARAAVDGAGIDPRSLPDAVRLSRLGAVRWHAFEAREGLRPLGDTARDIVAALR